MAQAATVQQPAKTGPPPWLAPALVLIVVLIVVLSARKEREAVENPVVDLAVITVGVFAFAAVFRWVFTMLNAPGAASFFGAPASNPRPSAVGS